MRDTIPSNNKTFETAAVILNNTLKSPEATHFFTKVHNEWKLNLKKVSGGGDIRVHDQVSRALFEEGYWEELPEP